MPGDLQSPYPHNLHLFRAPELANSVMTGKFFFFLGEQVSNSNAIK